jgi:hypothetical protein
MNVGLIDVDSHNFPNLALMKISAHHKAKGDQAEWWNGLKHYDKVYKSKVFDDTYSQDMEFCINADEVEIGGTGYDLQNKLSSEIEHTMPDYSLYNIFDTAYGFLTRGCPRACSFCIVSEKEGRKSYKVADIKEWWNGQTNIKLLDPNLLASKDHLDLLKQLADTKAVLDFTQGIDARMLTEENINILNQIKTYQIHFAWDFIDQSDTVMKGLELYKKYGKVDKDHRKAYVLTNYDTTHEEDLYRVYKLREMNYLPYVMIYNKPKAPKKTLDLQRWTNAIPIWRKCDRFENYIGGSK